MLLALAGCQRLERALRYLLDEREFLSPYGIRGLSAIHKDHPYVFRLDGQEYVVDYEPAESTNALFGGNSNWRGPVWFPVNYLLIESLQKYHYYFGDGFKVLRGGSWATRPRATRNTFRNWDSRLKRQIFAGIRWRAARTRRFPMRRRPTTLISSS